MAFARALVAPLDGTPVAREFDKLYDRLAGRQAPRSEQQGDLFARVWPNDHPTNGMALCKNHHWALDRFLIAPTVEGVWQVSSRLIAHRSAGEENLAGLEDAVRAIDFSLIELEVFMLQAHVHPSELAPPGDEAREVRGTMPFAFGRFGDGLARFGKDGDFLVQSV